MGHGTASSPASCSGCQGCGCHHTHTWAWREHTVPSQPDSCRAARDGRLHLEQCREWDPAVHCAGRRQELPWSFLHVAGRGGCLGTVAAVEGRRRLPAPCCHGAASRDLLGAGTTASAPGVNRGWEEKLPGLGVWETSPEMMFGFKVTPDAGRTVIPQGASRDRCDDTRVLPGGTGVAAVLSPPQRVPGPSPWQLSGDARRWGRRGATALAGSQQQM